MNLPYPYFQIAVLKRLHEINVHNLQFWKFLLSQSLETCENFSCDSFSDSRNKYNKVKLTIEVFIEVLTVIKMIGIFLFSENQFLNMACFIKLE